MDAPIDSVEVLWDGRIQIRMNIQIQGQDLSEDVYFESSGEVKLWINGKINEFKDLSANKIRGDIKPTQKETVELLDRLEGVKEKVLSLKK